MLWAVIRTRFEGIHYWKQAPKEKQFLSYPHRHLFYVEVWIEQFHSKRDVEYFVVKEWLDKEIKKMKPLIDMSCESIAKNISNRTRKRFKKRKAKVFVLEDNENGAVYEE